MTSHQQQFVEALSKLCQMFGVTLTFGNQSVGGLEINLWISQQTPQPALDVFAPGDAFTVGIAVAEDTRIEQGFGCSGQ